MPAPAPPPMEILVEFLRRLSGTLTRWDPVLVLRGSLLMRCWFGPRARPAADIDLECFERPTNLRDSRFGTPVAHARALCVFATEEGHGAGQERGASGGIAFEPIDPEDGTDLWDYGTPGERCYTLWISHHLKSAQGRLQIDIAQAGSYDLDAIGAQELELSTSGTAPFRFPAYTPEMLLAAKLSWIVRGLKRRPGSETAIQPRWRGASKDLFDAHLLLTEGKLHTDELQKGLYAVGAEDRLDWLDFEDLFEVALRMSDDDFCDWEEFQRQHESLIDCGPAELLRTVAERLTALLGDFRDHLPFLRAIKAEPGDEMAFLAYADWLDSRDDPRGNFLRLYSQWAFSPEKHMLLSPVRRVFARAFGSEGAMSPTRRALIAAMAGAPVAWLYHAFASPERYRQIRRQIENG